MALRTCVAIAAAGAVARTVWLVSGGSESLTDLFDHWVYHGALLLVAATCLIRGWSTDVLRGAWIAFGLGVLSWAAADLYWFLVLNERETISYPNVADLGFLGAYPFFYAGVLLLIKHRVGRMSASSWMDGAIGGLAAAALVTAILGPALVGLTQGDTAAVITNFSYPLGDLILIGFIVATLVVGGLRGAGSLVLVAVALGIWSAGDAIFLYREATGAFSPGWVSQTWLFGGLLIGASVLRAGHAAIQHRAPRPSMLFPALFSSIAVGVLVWDHFEPVHGAAIWLAATTLGAMLVRLTLSLRENRRLIAVLHDDSLTDALTGLKNRRCLNEDLAGALDPATGDPAPHVFALFDLDGFKAYNDNFGHPAGDALLRRLGTGLRAAVGSSGDTYRLGGDEFCILARAGGAAPATEIVESAREGLSVEGEGFTIRASAGFVLLPAETVDPSEALRLADQRMYAEKDQRPGHSIRSAHDFLRHIAREHDLPLSNHLDGVAHLAVEVGRRLRLGAEDLDVLGRAAELHDIGKIAIPCEILDKPGPLDADEWTLMRQHTLVGARMLNALPAMGPVARAVRSSHERWDGSGYPDRLAGGRIPLPARIVSVCDAFDAMRANRPYDPARSTEAALAELERCAGTQFDPAVVEAFCSLFEIDPQGPAHSSPGSPGEHQPPLLVAGRSGFSSEH